MANLAGLTEESRKLALDRFRLIQPHLEQNQSLQSVAYAAGVPYRTAQRWVAQYRLSRSLRDVLTIMERLGESAAGFRSLTEAIDTTTAAGRMMMQMIGAFAEFERAMLKERTKVGLDAAREEGRIGGRRPKLSPHQQAEIKKMVSKGDKTAADAARLFKIHPATVSRLVARTLPSARKRKHAK